MHKTIYYEKASMEYELFDVLREKFKNDKWVEIQNHNNIPEMRSRGNHEFAEMKNDIVIGVRKTHKYTENHKISDFLVPYTSSGCSAMCLYCYLVCNYNKCSYLRLFVNREEILARLIKHAAKHSATYEIGSNSDLILENTITGNLIYTIEQFGSKGKGFLTFPTKFSAVDPILNLNHRGRTIVRISVNPENIINEIEKRTSPLDKRLDALVSLYDAGYPIGILIAPVIFTENWKSDYTALLQKLSCLPSRIKKDLPVEIIFMTYSFIHRKINEAAFGMDLYDGSLMTGRGRGKYCYRRELRAEGENYFKEELHRFLPESKIIYFS